MAWHMELVYTTVTSCVCPNLVLRERHDFCAKARKNELRHKLGTYEAQFRHGFCTAFVQFRHGFGTVLTLARNSLGAF